MTYHDYVRTIAFDVHYALRTPDGDPSDPEVIYPAIRARLSKGDGIDPKWDLKTLIEDIAIIVYNLVGE